MTFASSLTEEVRPHVVAVLHGSSRHVARQVKSLVVDTAIAAGSVMGAVSEEVSGILHPKTAIDIDPADAARHALLIGFAFPSTLHTPTHLQK